MGWGERGEKFWKGQTLKTVSPLEKVGRSLCVSEPPPLVDMELCGQTYPGKKQQPRQTPAHPVALTDGREEENWESPFKPHKAILRSYKVRASCLGKLAVATEHLWSSILPAYPACWVSDLITANPLSALQILQKLQTCLSAASQPVKVTTTVTGMNFFFHTPSLETTDMQVQNYSRLKQENHCKLPDNCPSIQGYFYA